MAQKQVPDVWTEKQVRVGLATTQQTRAGVGPGGESEPSGRLVATNPSGLVLLQRVEEGERPVFYPWGFVAWVYPVEEQFATEEQESRSLGVPTGPARTEPGWGGAS